jgi:Integrase zinc binding domain
MTKRLTLIMQAHDELGHKGLYLMQCMLLDRFWWPRLEHDVTWFIKTCHECQIRNTVHLFISPTPSISHAVVLQSIFRHRPVPSCSGIPLSGPSALQPHKLPSVDEAEERDRGCCGKVYFRECAVQMGRGGDDRHGQPGSYCRWTRVA